MSNEQPITREEMLASLKPICKDDAIPKHWPQDHPLLAIGMWKNLIAAGDTVLIYDKIEALVVLVTKSRDLIIEVDGHWYLCFSYFANITRMKPL